jgi:hypothetical protein
MAVMATDSTRQRRDVVECRRFELISIGRLEPRRGHDPEAWPPLPPVIAGERTLTEILMAMRAHERT